VGREVDRALDAAFGNALQTHRELVIRALWRASWQPCDREATYAAMCPELVPLDDFCFACTARLVTDGANERIEDYRTAFERLIRGDA
jgi:hypothetical protein